MPPLRILRAITRLNIGGPSVHAALLSTKLDPVRFSTCLVTGEPEAGEGDLSGLVQGDHARVIKLKTLRRPLRPWLDLWCFFQLFHIIWRERPDLLHTHMAKAGALGRLAGMTYNAIGPGRRRERRVLLIHTFHGHVLEGYFPLWLSRVFVIIERWLARRTDCLIAVSQAIRDDLVSKGIGRPEQWRVVPLGLDLSELGQLPLPNGSPALRVGMVGRLVPIKNPSLFLQALDRLARRAQGDAVYGVIVGDGPLRHTLEREAEALGLTTLVRFMGWQRNPRTIYEGLEATCLTSWNEGTPVALIEAMAAGRAVVATDVGGVRDVLEGPDRASSTTAIPVGSFQVTERGVLVRPGDPDGLAAALAAVADDADLRWRLGEAARGYVAQHFSEERLLRDMTALYEDVRTRRRP